jgi:four helix bundle protein
MPQYPTDTDGHGHGHAGRPTDHGTRPERRRRNDLHQLDVYRCALLLYRCVGRIVAAFPRGEADLRSQMKRAARSVPFNIGEGVGKRGKARAAAYQIALGEAKELIVALDCVDIDGLAPVHEVETAQDLADRICAMLTKLIRVTRAEPENPSTVDRVA